MIVSKKQRAKVRARRRSGGADMPKPPPRNMPTVTASGMKVNLKDPMRFYLDRQYDKLSEWFGTVVQTFFTRLGTELSAQNRRFVDHFAETLLFFFTKPDYVISQRFVRPFVFSNPLITNLVAISRFGSTDPQIEILLDQPNSFVKILTLYSARNTVRIDRGWLFQQDPELASLWYAHYYHAAIPPRTRVLWENVREHQRHLDERFVIDRNTGTAPTCLATYVDPRTERPVKEKMNELIRRKFQGLVIRNDPKRNRIAVMTDRWHPRSSVYRAFSAMLEALAGDYEMTLVHLGEQRGDLDTHLFRDVLHMQVALDGSMDLSPVAKNDFQLVYFPDVGMSVESKYLSNLRIAPIQIMTYGHPVSTWGARIDYVIAGAEMEAIERAEENYSERLVVLPGAASLVSIPSYQPARPAKTWKEVVITCAWNSAKCNYPMLCTLREILQRATRHVIFQFLPEVGALEMGNFILFRKDVEEILGADHARLLATSGDSYMRAQEIGDFAIDSYPFGSFTSVADTLKVGKPIVAWEGDMCYNLAAARILRKVGLEELVATSQREYIEVVCRLIEDEAYRNGLSERIWDLDLDGRINDRREPAHFRQAIDFLIENHQALQQGAARKPILIGP